MFNFHLLGKGLELVSSPCFVNDFLRKMAQLTVLLTDQISLSDCFYFSRYWAICVLQLFVNQAMTS